MDTSVTTILRDFNDNRRLLRTLDSLRLFVDEHNLYDYGSRMDDIRRNYLLMLDYMERGYADDKRRDIYNDMLGQVYRLLQDINLDYRIRTVPSYQDADHRCRAARFNGDKNDIKQNLENYVAEMAMLSLEAEPLREERRRQLLEAHDVYMSRLFDWLFLSRQWTDSDAAFYRDLLTSPAIDTADVLWMVGAITLSCINIFDIKKLQTLVSLYTAGVAEALRQRALVGWALAMDSSQTLMVPEQKETVSRIVGADGGLENLKDLQIQLLTCVNAIHDDECIKRDIMPILLKQSSKDMAELTKDITASSDINEILHPEASEQIMDEVENAMMKMKQMAAKGKDIYYGGFCQAKRFGFFSQVSHWFEPFFVDHPAIKFDPAASADIRSSMSELLSMVPFCDSDKYSFVFLFSNMIDRLPEQLRKAIMENKAGFMPVGIDEPSEVAVLRRNYLHDLFRFYNLYAARDDFRNPFMYRQTDGVVNVFVADDRLFGDVDGSNDLRYDVLRFLGSTDTPKGSHYGASVRYFLSGPRRATRFGDRLFVANYMLRHDDRHEAYELFKQLVADYPDNVHALRGAASSCMELKDYGAALGYYERLAVMDEENIAYQFNRARCLVMEDRIGDALPILHKLHFNYPDRVDIQRVKLWAMLKNGQYEQSCAEYDKLCKTSHADAEDCLNHGYSLWLLGNNADAVAAFRRYLQMKQTAQPDAVSDIFEAFRADANFLLGTGLSETDIRVMADLVDIKTED